MVSKNVRRTISMVLVLLMVCSSMLFAKGTDYLGHWAEASIQNWIDKGYIKGYPDGTFKPENDITRAEFMTIVNRSFEFTAEAEVSYKDVNASHWAYIEFKRANAAGYIGGFEDGTLRPNNKITREEVAVIITRLLSLKEEKDSKAFLDLKDFKQVPDWSSGAVSAIVDKGYMKLRGKDFAPKLPATRAEVIDVLNRGYLNLIKIKYNEAGTYTAGIVDGSIEINAKDVILEDTTINGNLIIGEAVGSGNVTLKNVIVKGDTIVRGGGINSIIIEDSEIINLIIEKIDGKVRILAKRSTYIHKVDMRSGGKLEARDQDANNFGYIVIAENLSSDEPIILVGNFKNIEVKSGDNEIQIQGGTIKNLVIANTAKGAKVNLASGAKVDAVEINAAARIDGKGKIGTARVNVEGVEIIEPLGEMIKADGVNEVEIIKPIFSGGGGGGGGGLPPSVEVSAININKSTTTLVEGTTETLTVTFTPSNASNKTITWTTSDASKATIDSTGKVRAVSAGTATITAKSNNGKTATCVVTVTTTVVPVSAIKVNKTTTTLTVGATETITATVQPTNASNKNVTWSSSKDAIATVDANGKVTAVAEGTATITVTSVADSSKKATVGVTVKAETLVSDFEFDASTKTIIKYKGTEKSVAIPAKIGGVDVEVIGEEAFSNKYLTSVVIPNSVTSIEKHAFIANKLTSVVIPDSVTSINQGAFSNNELTSINIPNSVTTIEKEVFQYNKLTSIVIPDSVTTIGQWAFLENELTSIEIPNSVATIGASAFLENKLTSLVIPNSVKTIEEAAFNNNKLPDAQAFIYARKSDGTEDKSKIVSYGGAKRENVIIPNSVKTIGEAAFAENELLSITIPNSVTTIEDYAFEDNKLTEVTIPISVTTLGDGAFEANGPSSNSGTISTIDFVGTWEIKDSSEVWTKKGVVSVSAITVTGAEGATTITTDKGTLQMKATVTPEEASNKAVTWSVDDTSKATINASGLLTAVANGTVKVTATAKDGSGVVGAVTIIVSNQVVTPTKYAVTVTNGTGDGDYEVGATVSITANAPATGKVFDKWTSLDGVSFTDANAATTSFTMPAKAVTVEATYKDAPVTTYTVTVSDDGNGTGTANPATAEKGKEITLAATANSGFQFKEWQVVSGEITISSNKFTMPAGNVEVKAIFEALPPVISGVTISPKTTSVQKGTSATFSAVVTGTGAFDSTVTWSVSGGISGTNIDNNGKLTVDASETATTITVNATANGDSSKSDSATVTITDAPITKYAVTVTNGTGNGNFAEGATVNITANDPTAGKEFDQWTSSDGVTFENANNASTTFEMPANAVTVTATYKNIDYTISYVLNSGTNNASNPVTYTIETDTITLADATRADYIFEGWYKEAGFTNKVTQIAKGSTGDMTLYAKWAEITQLTIGDPTITTSKQYDGNTTTTVTAGSLNGVASDDTVTVSAVANYDNENIGTGKTITVVYTLTGKDAGKYIKPIDYTTTGKITAVQLSIGNPKLTKTKVYDGNTKAVVTAGTLNGVVGSEVVNVDASANYDSADVGTNKTITVIYTISGTDAGNYIAPENDTVTDGEITTSTSTHAEIAKDKLTSETLTPQKVIFNTDRDTTISDAQGVVKRYLETLIINATVEVVWKDAPATISNEEVANDYNFKVTITGTDGSEATIDDFTVNVQIEIGYFEFNTGTGTITGIASTEYKAAKGLNLVIPESINGVDVEAIGLNAFANMVFTSVEIPNKVKVIGEGAFKNNKFITVIIPDSVTSIGSFAFLNNELTEVTIPDSVTTIGESAFKDNKLTKVTIPTSVTYLGANEFLENGPEKNTTNTPTEPGTWNVVGTEWVKENNAPTVVSGQETQTGTATPASNDDKTAAVDYIADVSAWFEDVDTGDTLTYSVVSAKDEDSADVSVNVTISGNDITYTPVAAQADKTVTIVVKANDGTVDSTGNVTITVTVGLVPADAPSIDPDHLSFSAATNKFTVAAEAPTGTYKIFFNDSDTADTTTVSHITGSESVSEVVVNPGTAGENIHYTFTETDKEESEKTADGVIVATLGAPTVVLGHVSGITEDSGYNYNNRMHPNVDFLSGDNTIENIIEEGIVVAYSDSECTNELGRKTITSTGFNNLEIGSISEMIEVSIYIKQTDIHGNESGVTEIKYVNGN